jgi:hypothetical protein
MKRNFIFIAIMLLCSIANAQTTRSDTATVLKVRGVPVFVMCEPTAAYEVTGSVTDSDFGSVLNSIDGKNTYRTIKESCNVIINNALRKQTKGKFQFDAILISDDGHSGTCIKFK